MLATTRRPKNGTMPRKVVLEGVWRGPDMKKSQLPSRAKAASSQCAQPAAPPPRLGGMFPVDETGFKSEWEYLFALEHDSGLVTLEQVSWTPMRQALCRGLFANGVPPRSPAEYAAASLRACVLQTWQDTKLGRDRERIKEEKKKQGWENTSESFASLRTKFL